MVGAWRAAGAAAYDSALLGGQAADARFNRKVFAKLVGCTEAKVDEALGRLQAAPAATEPTLVPTPPPLLSLDVVLLREIEAKLTQLRADGFATLCTELDAVLASKKRAPATAAVAENATPNAGVPPRPPPAQPHTLTATRARSELAP
eukprot:6443426-Prymnesium_polylepis.1